MVTTNLIDFNGEKKTTLKDSVIAHKEFNTLRRVMVHMTSCLYFRRRGKWQDHGDRDPALHALGTREVAFSSESGDEWALVILGNAGAR